MSKTYFIKDATLIDIGDAIRSKTGATAKIPASQMASAIRNTLDGNTHDLINGTISYINDDKITTVRPYAFYECNELHTAILPNASSIGTYGFYSCEKLATLYAPKATSVGGSGLVSCTSLTNVDLGLTAALSSNCTVGTYLRNNQNLKSVTIASPRIDNEALAYCRNLSYASFANATSVGTSAFRDCNKLTSVYLPKAVTIQGLAFYSCKALEELYLPEVTNVAGSRAFEQMPSLKILDLPKCTAMNASGCFAETAYLSWVRVGFSTTVSNAFANKTGLSYFEASQGITLATNCLTGCNNLTKISFPKATTIGSTAFNGCVKLSSFSFPVCTKVSDAAFSNCSGITQLSKANFPTAFLIGPLAFQKCVNLSKVSVACTNVQLNAFTGCTKLTELDLTVPSLTVSNAMSSLPITKLTLRNCSTVTSYVFKSCHNLVSVYTVGPTNFSLVGAFENCSAITTLSMPSCTQISYATFKNCHALSSVYLPAVTTMGRECFAFCSNLTTVDLPALTTFYYSTKASQMAFYSCPKLSYVRLGGLTTMSSMLLQNNTVVKSVKLDNCTTLNANCFSGMTVLISASLPKVATVNATAFYNCKALTSINLPSAVTVQKLAFQNCSAMTTASMPKLTTLATSAFVNCYKLSQFTIPATVSIIYTSTFLNCSALISLRIEGSTLKALSATNAFAGTPLSVSTLTGNFGSIYVPASLLASYKAATNWKTYSARMVSY